MDEEIIDVKIGERGEEDVRKELGLEEFLGKNKFTVGIFILGIVLLGAGVLGFKIFEFSANQPKVEILGESDSPLTSSNHPLTSSIVVEAAGEIMKPGVFELVIGSRVNDLLTVAGGLSAEADREWVGKNINLAQKLVDGAKIFVPKRTEFSNSNFQFSDNDQLSNFQNSKININIASESELDTLWGVGPATARKIIQGRPYQRVEELMEKKIIKSNVWEEIKEKITVY